jgi:ABC-type glutathione transport system ATPase component
MRSLLDVQGVSKYFANGLVHAVRDVTFQVASGECLGLVGESGCGKSTIAAIIASLIRADSGRVLLEGQDIAGVSGVERRQVFRKVQMVFQSPMESFNPRMTLGDSVAEGLVNTGMAKAEARRAVGDLLGLCGLSEKYAGRYPHQVSGGECQRASIARAVAVEPRLVICDEATSALDVSIQAEILGLIARLKRELGMSFLVISHDIALTLDICDRVLVMNSGRLVEEGAPTEILSRPRSEYTRELIDAALLMAL